MTPSDDSQSVRSDARAFFDGLADSWAERYRNDPAMAARLARFSKALSGRVAPGSAVLDFGCGAGVIACWLNDHGYSVSACDLSAEMIKEARRIGTSVQFDTCGTGPLPYTNGAFAAVVSSSVLEYVVDLGGTLDELHRVLVPDGWLLVTVPDSRHPHRRKEAILRAALRLPIMGHWIARSRWAEGAAYLRLSRNRLAPAAWVRLLARHGFYAEPVTACDGPLLLLVAYRKEPAE